MRGGFSFLKSLSSFPREHSGKLYRLPERDQPVRVERPMAGNSPLPFIVAGALKKRSIARQQLAAELRALRAEVKARKKPFRQAQVKRLPFNIAQAGGWTTDASGGGVRFLGHAMIFAQPRGAGVSRRLRISSGHLSPSWLH